MKQTLKYIYAQVIELQKYSESKHAITLTLSSGVIVFSATFLSRENNYVVIASTFAILFSLFAILYSFFALSAKSVVISKSKTKTCDNLIYYKDIAHFDEKNYVEAIQKSYGFPKSYVPDNFDYDLAKQIISSAKVIKKKFRYFNLSVSLLILSILGLVVTIALAGRYA